MLTVLDERVVLDKGVLLSEAEAKAKGIDVARATENTLAARILDAHNTPSASDDLLHIRFDAMASHDITYVGIIQSARASGLERFPLPYALTNCHNSLCAVGGTINEDDHLFGLTAAKKYGGIFVPPHLAVIHQYVREMLAGCGKMVLASDSHTRYGALGCMGVGEGGPELVKQLLNRTYDIPKPDVILIWLENAPRPGVGPQDIAIALIGEVFKSGFVKNRVLEFAGPGVASMSVEYRCGVDVMTTETTCLSSIWTTDDKVRDYLTKHGRADEYRELTHDAPAAYRGCVKIDLATVEPMIALPFHPSNAYPVAEVIAHADELLGEVEANALKLFGKPAEGLKLREKIHDGGVWVDQGIIAGCAGGSFENCAIAAAILDGKSTGHDAFSLSVYPASEPQALGLVRNGSYAKLMAAGAILKNAFCGPCFGAGDTPAHGALSIRHSTRNFPNREGSKPGGGQLSGVALMDARSIAATAANGGRLTPATDLDWDKLSPNLDYEFDALVYKTRCYSGYDAPKPEQPLKLGPNITDWPTMLALPENLVLRVASVINDPVTTTDELIPSGETSSLRSNPLKLAEFALSRRDPGYVGRAKATQAEELAREKNMSAPVPAGILAAFEPLKAAAPDVWAAVFGGGSLADTGIGSTIFARKPGDGSAREQAASSQKVLGGWANLAEEYATKRYRSNLINWGMLPFLTEAGLGEQLAVDDMLLVPGVRAAVANPAVDTLEAWLVHDGAARKLTLRLGALSDEERSVILDGCLINHYSADRK